MLRYARNDDRLNNRHCEHSEAIHYVIKNMISYLRGLIISLSQDKCVIDVNGVGYLVYISAKSYSVLQSLSRQEPTSLVIETIVKEDAIELYGFFSENEREWFLELLKVQGVGAKVAQKILSYFSIEEMARALIAEDEKAFTKISGIGPKVAGRIVIELKNTPKKLGIAASDLNVGASKNINISGSQIARDALSALENLGYKKHDCLKVIDFILTDKKEITLENLITSCLREFNKNKF